MAATLLDGNKIANEILAEVAAEVRNLSAAGVRPGLAVILVGKNPASEIYVRGKVKSSEEVGIYSEKFTPAESITTDELLELVLELNQREEIDGILVQLPLPPQVDSKKILMAVDPAKDVDGFHPVNVGFLSTEWHSDRWPGSRGGGTQRYRRQACCHAADQRQRHGHRLPLENSRSSGCVPPRRHSGCSHRPRRNDHSRLREAGCHRDRRRHE